MTRPADAPASGLVPDDGGHVWHTLSAGRVLQAERVDGQRGLSAAEVTSRAQRSGPSKFAEGKAESRWRAFSLDTFSDKTFNIATGVSVLTLILATVIAPFQKFLSTTGLDLQQWLVCIAVALSIIVVSEIRKAIRRWATVKTVQAAQPALSSPSAAA